MPPAVRKPQNHARPRALTNPHHQLRPLYRLWGLLVMLLLPGLLGLAPLARASTSSPGQDAPSAVPTERARASESNTPGSFLTPPNQGDPLAIALAYIRAHKADLGLMDDDIADIVVKDRYVSPHNKVTHLYLRQRLDGIEVDNADININLTRDGRIINLGNRFVSNLRARANTATALVGPVDAVRHAAAHLRLRVTERLVELSPPRGKSRKARVSRGGISQDEIPVEIMYQPTPKGDVRLAWNMVLRLKNNKDWLDLQVDAVTGALLAQVDWIVSEQMGAVQVAGADSHTGATDSVHGDHAARGTSGAAFGNAAPITANVTTVPGSGSYVVYAMPAEDPGSAERTTATDPATALASPFGWHDTDGTTGHEFTIPRGNNVHAYQDSRNINSSSGDEPDGGSELAFSFPIDLTQQPSTNLPAAVTNLFYWNNIIHDVFYSYGFNEAAGNFQQNNYGRGGLGGDYVQAEAQNGGAFTRADFAAPPDGSPARMQMYLGDLADPMRDGALDNLVIIHEYGHGISTRLTGGPSNADCLNADEQPGEGWSDFFSLALTAEAADTRTTSRTVGRWLAGQSPTGSGFRAYPYTTDMVVNPETYNSIKTAGIPHGVGEVWAAMLWEMYWNLVGEYGFDPNFYTGTGGNNRAIQLVVDGLKLQPCNPSFVDARDAILSADQADYAGANQCLIWRAFAKRGLGYSATAGSSSDATDGAEAFDIPVSCQQDTSPTTTSVTSSPNPSVSGGSVTFTAMVTSDGNPVTEGTLSFTDGATTLGSPVYLDASGQALLSTSHLSPGSHAITAQFHGTGDFGPSSGTVTQNVVEMCAAPTTEGSNTAAITIADYSPGAPYPSTIAVTGLDGHVVRKVTATLSTITHTWPHDIDIMLVGPGGQRTVLMSDSGGGSTIENVTLTFDDTASAGMPAHDQIVAGTYQPTNFDGSDPFPEPAPGPGPDVAALSVFDGTDPNGTWSLYTVDDSSGDQGQIAGGWSLRIETDHKCATTTTVASSRNPSASGEQVTFTAHVAGGSSTPTGRVVFRDGAEALGTGVLNTSGDATFSTSALGAGSHSIRAVYEGDITHSASISPALLQAVNADITIDDVTVVEGSSESVNAVFTLRLSTPSTEIVTVDYVTADGSATAGSDYTAGSGTISFPAGATTQTVTIPVLGDTLDERNESFAVNLSGAVNATIADAQGVGGILDDDDPPSMTIDDVKVVEGNSGSRDAVFTLRLSAASTEMVTVNYATADGSAAAGSDYTAGSGTLSFAAGVTTRRVTVAVRGDKLSERNETFFLKLTRPVRATIADAVGVGTIINDD